MQTETRYHHKKTKPNKLNLLAKIVVLVFFVVTTSGYALSIVSGNLFYYYLFVPTGIMLLLILANKNNLLSLKINIYNFSYIGLCLVLIFSFLVNLNMQYFAYNVRLLVTISFAFFFTFYVKQEDFIKYFVTVMKYIVIISLIVYVPVTFFNIGLNLPIFENINGVCYYNGIIFFVFEGYVQGRNIGCFWEPGVFATFITFAMIFEISLKRKSSKWNIIIFVLGLLSTQSTAGYFMMIFVLLLALSKRVKDIKASIGFFLVIFGALLAYFNIDKMLSYLVMINPRVFSKLFDQTASLTSRIDSPFANLEIFGRFPIFGAGIGNADTIYSQIIPVSQTSTSTYFLAAFGIFGIMYTFLWVYGILNFKKVNIFTRITMVIMVLLIVNKEPHTFFTATYIIMFYFLKFTSNNIKQAHLTNKELVL